MSRFVLFALAALCLLGLLGEVSASNCLAYPPPLKKGQACGFGSYCANNLHCNKAGVCSEKLAAGEACQYSSQCANDVQCRGPSGATICVPYANPGEQCTIDNEDTTRGYCRYSCVEGVCRGGQVGDGCTATADCSGNLTCTNNLCTPLNDGQICISSNDCKPQSYCDQNNICRPKKTSGLCPDYECAYGYFCVGFSNNDVNGCYPEKSREVGEYCNDDRLCKGSLRCHNNRCAAKKLTEGCDSNYQCGAGQFCSCGGDYLDQGYGTCKTDPCQAKYERYSECVSMNCKGYSTGFSKACAVLNCKDEVDAVAALCADT